MEKEKDARQSTRWYDRIERRQGMQSASIWERKAQSSLHNLEQRSNPSTTTQSNTVRNFARTRDRAVFVGPFVGVISSIMGIIIIVIVGFGGRVLVGWLLLVGMVWGWVLFLWGFGGG